jgi:hypothetical protein
MFSRSISTSPVLQVGNGIQSVSHSMETRTQIRTTLLTVGANDDDESRYEKMASVVADHFSAAKRATGKQLSDEVVKDLDLIFEIKQLSYRELALVVALANEENKTYNATKDLYSSHPRSLYEKSIRPELARRRIPHGQSPALNIAKATEALDKSWIAQRRPPEAATALSRLAAFFASAKETQLKTAIRDICARFIDEGSNAELRTFSGDPTAQLSRLSRLVRELVRLAPDGGNTAQRIAGILIEQLNASSPVVVDGTQDKASVTNATSKKPGDISVSDENGNVLMVFEVTTKAFKDQRIAECSQALEQFATASGQKIERVCVLCRDVDVPDFIVPTDPPSGIFLGSHTHDGYEYEFVEIFGWADAILATLNEGERLNFMTSLVAYVNDFQTSANVKSAFAQLNNQ